MNVNCTKLTNNLNQKGLIKQKMVANIEFKHLNYEKLHIKYSCVEIESYENRARTEPVRTKKNELKLDEKKTEIFRFQSIDKN